MFYSPRFFYDDNAGDAGGGSPEGDSSNTDTGGDQKPVNTEVNLLKPLFSEEDLKGFGFDTVDQLKQHLQKNRENMIPDADKKKAADLEKAEFISVATSEGLMNIDEYTAYEGIGKKADRDLVYEKYVAEFKEDNPDATDELIRSEFESEYKLADKNDKTKSRGEARLKKEAEELRSPLSGKYNVAKEFVDNYRMSKKELPVFHKFIDDLVQELTPDTFNIAKVKDGDDELEIPVTFTKEQRDEIAKLFKTNKHFASYVDNKDKLKETLSPSLTKKIQSIIKVNNFDTAAAYALKHGKGIGTKQGSTVGAEQPFAVVRSMPKVVVSKSDQDTLNESDKKLREKYAK